MCVGMQTNRALGARMLAVAFGFSTFGRFAVRGFPMRGRGFVAAGLAMRLRKRRLPHGYREHYKDCQGKISVKIFGPVCDSAMHLAFHVPFFFMET
jgi:hypothetical protein